MRDKAWRKAARLKRIRLQLKLARHNGFTFISRELMAAECGEHLRRKAGRGIL